ncbi:MAG: hypothetical protein OJF49_001757 [Ktedonobacterales bacterium]|nr:MAG: hypothetical protein OJF49_001757 [Ktedonobacterales bacterium]
MVPIMASMILRPTVSQTPGERQMRFLLPTSADAGEVIT